MPPVPEDAITAAFLRLYYNLKHNPEVLSFHIKQMTEVLKRQMLWSPAAMELNREISDILNQSHALALLNKQGLVDPDIFISKSNQLAEQLRNAKHPSWMLPMNVFQYYLPRLQREESQKDLIRFSIRKTEGRAE